MTGRFLTDTRMGPTLITVSEAGGGYAVVFEPLALGMPMAADSVQAEGDTLTVTSSFFMAPGQTAAATLAFDGTGYSLSGSHILLGECSGTAQPFTGKTKADEMVELLPQKRTGKVVKRTRAEIDAAVEALLGRMTLTEKIGQMCQSIGSFGGLLGNTVDNRLPEDERIRLGMVGAINGMSPLPVTFEKQRLAVEESRLGIPLLFCQDVIHGKDTIFPIPLAGACSFDPALVQKAARVAAQEATATGIMYDMGPMVDISRDPRWGRVSEGAGEDPYLGSLMSEAQVKGYQGDSLYDADTMMACLKHFIGYGAAEGGRDYNTVEISDTTLRNVYLPPFKAGLDAGAASIMNSFNVINGVPMAINKQVLNTLLRDELGFEGIVISDFGSIDECLAHGAAEDIADAAAKALEASLDIEMATTAYEDNLAALLESGRVEEALVDNAVRRILRYKYETGIMDDPYKYFRPEDAAKSFSAESRALSRALARESIVLLKNNGVLPLAKGTKVAVIGPKGDSKDLLGPWQFTPKSGETVTLREGLEAAGYEVVCAKGCDTLTACKNGIQEAVAAAKGADVILLALGEDAGMSGEAASRQNITVPEPQMELARAMKELGKPLVLVLTNGRPLLLEWFEENADAVVESWFLGSEAGGALADVLSGSFNPCGKLAMTFPRHQGQIPLYYNHQNTGRPYEEGAADKFLSRYLDGPNTPLYPFGHGLSYTSFALGEIALSAGEIGANDTLTATVTLQNTGRVAGTQVVQLYLRDVAASISRPVKELKGFERVTLEPGESREVRFAITEPMLRFVNAACEEVSEPGRFDVMVGLSSDDKDLVKGSFSLR